LYRAKFVQNYFRLLSRAKKAERSAFFSLLIFHPFFNLPHHLLDERRDTSEAFSETIPRPLWEDGDAETCSSIFDA